jgi:hypothetical protein
MDENEDRAPAPWHLWVVGIVSLLWSGGGMGYDYIQTKRLDTEYIGMMSDMMGIGPHMVHSYFVAFPLWMNIAWAVGVWAAVVGSVLLLLRSRQAYPAFVVSLAGIAISMAYQFVYPLPGVADSTLPTIMAVLVPLITIALAWYARKQTAAGVLR